METHKRLGETIASPKWEDYFKDGAFSGYTMKGDEGFVAIKSVGVIPCTPIEVLSHISLIKPARRSATFLMINT